MLLSSSNVMTPDFFPTIFMSPLLTENRNARKYKDDFKIKSGEKDL